MVLVGGLAGSPNPSLALTDSSGFRIMACCPRFPCQGGISQSLTLLRWSKPLIGGSQKTGAGSHESHVWCLYFGWVSSRGCSQWSASKSTCFFNGRHSLHSNFKAIEHYMYQLNQPFQWQVNIWFSTPEGQCMPYYATVIFSNKLSSWWLVSEGKRLSTKQNQLFLICISSPLCIRAVVSVLCTL